MKLYFLRHGQAVESNEWRGAEIDRPLTDAGRDEMHGVARGLRALDLRLTAIYSSPLARARETAEIAAQAFALTVIDSPALASDCDLDDLTLLLAQHSHDEAVMFVGHEPDLVTMIGRLIAKSGLAHVTMKKASCCAIHLYGAADRPLAGRGELRWLMTAQQLTAIGASH